MRLTFLIMFAGTIMSFNASASPLDSVRFMQGCWETTNDDGQKVTEDWFNQATGLMLGVSQTRNKDGSMAQYEFLEIKLDTGSGKVTYTPFLNGKKLNQFTLEPKASQSGKKTLATFSDPSNATLKTLVYSLKDAKTLNVRLIGSSKSGEPFDFNYDMASAECKTHF